MPTPGQPMFTRRLGPAVRLGIWSSLSILLIVLDTRLQALEWLRSAAATLYYPVQVVARAPFQAGAEISGFLQRHNDLQEQNQRMHAAWRRDGAQLARLTTLEAENAELRRQLDLRSTTAFQPLAAEILGIPRDPFSRRVMLDKGGNAGVQAGQPVVDGRGLVGQVTRVFPLGSEVTLITDRNQAVPAQIQRSGQRVLVYGAGVGLEVRYLPTHADIQHGDVLVTSGIDRVYPAGLAVARVTRVTRPADSPYARVVCQPMAGVETSRVLMVLKGVVPHLEVALPETRPDQANSGARP